MKKSRIIILLFIAGILGASAASHGLTFHDSDQAMTTEPIDPEDIAVEEDTVYVWHPDSTREYLPGEVRDTAQFNKINTERRNYESVIHLLARTYGDSIVLRWAPDDYVSWQYLNAVGVNIYRMPILNAKNTDTEFRIDTLAYQLKPASLEQWKAQYPESDSVAMIAMGSLYSAGGFTQDQSRHRTGEIGALLDVYDDQQLRFGMAVLASEWRRDVAENLAMRFVDKKVKKGEKYRYIVRPAEFDSTNNLQFRVGFIEEIENKNYVPEPYEAVMGDSVVGINQLRIWWEQTDRFSSFDIHRRAMGEHEWTKVNDNPYIMMRDIHDIELDNFINDNIRPGTYEYRISGYDTYGDLIAAKNYHVASMPDLEAPRPPKLKSIVIHRRNPDDLSKDVYADFHFSKDTIESDFIGYKILYYQRSRDDRKAEWVELTPDLIPANDTVWTVDVSKISTSQVTVAAYDSAQNVSYSMTHVMRVTDLNAPDAPTNFRYEILDNQAGTVKLSWTAPSFDIDYYELAFANDTTHKFMLRSMTSGTLLRDTTYVDTLAVDVNQKYIYYKVRAIDYASNEGVYTAPLQVIRPSMIKPAVPHIDSVWVDQVKGVRMRWACSNEQQISHHVLMRRLANAKEWTTVAIYDGDSLRNAGNMVDIIDVPEYVRRNRYEYAMESFTYAGISSGLSLVYSTRFEGERVFEWPIKLIGHYDERNKTVKIVWETNKNLPYKGEWYYCVYRKGPNDKKHKFLMSVNSDALMFQDNLLSAGESAEYFVRIRYKDGRATTDSNIVVVTAPKAKDKK